jgi:hypothetical protein
MASATALGQNRGASPHMALHARSPFYNETSVRGSAGISAVSYEEPLSWPPLLYTPTLCRQKSSCLFNPCGPEFYACSTQKEATGENLYCAEVARRRAIFDAAVAMPTP